MNIEPEHKKQMNYIFTQITSRYRDVCAGRNTNIIELIISLYWKMTGNYTKCLGLLDLIFSNISA